MATALSSGQIAAGAMRAKAIFPGLAASATIAMAATFLSDHHGGPTLLYALLIGMAFHFVSKDSAAAPGIALTAKTILRIGVALLGVRISAAQIAEIGIMPLITVVAGVTATILFGSLLSRLLGLSRSQGVLTGGAVAICGASAALAISAVLPKTKGSEKDTLFTVIAVTTLSTLAMVLYPLLARAFGLDARAAGILLGGTIHDVAQVVAAGHLISDEAGTIATYVKLLRVSMLMPVVAVLTWLFVQKRGGEATGGRPLLPGFLVAFAALAVANSFGLIPSSAAEAMNVASRWCLVCAIAALGMKTSLQELASIGWRAMALVVLETLFLLALVGCALALFG